MEKLTAVNKRNDLIARPDICFTLVRHGQTDWNQDGRYQGQADVPLNTIGILQAKEAAEHVRGKHVDIIYSSDLSRAVQTAEEIARVVKVPLIIDPRLREINLGEWEGQLFSDIKVKYPELIHLREIAPLKMRPPGGETLGEVANRVYEFADEIAASFSQNRVLLVSHGLALAVLIVKAREMPLEHAYQFIPENAVPLEIEWFANSHRKIKDEPG
jgi:broad specificity phosphatase PhoE